MHALLSYSVQNTYVLFLIYNNNIPNGIFRWIIIVNANVTIGYQNITSYVIERPSFLSNISVYFQF